MSVRASLRKPLALSAAAVALVVMCAAEAGATSTIDFEGVDATCIFSDATPIRTLPSAPGVHFSGTAENSGGAVLDGCANFRIAPRSGSNFLAFNRGAMFEDGRPHDAETIRFDEPVTQVSIWASGGGNTASFSMEAYDGADELLGSLTIDVPGAMWGELSLSLPGISSVVLRELEGDNSFVFDDLSFGTVPEPTTAALLGLAAALLLAGSRRRQPARRAS